MFALFVRLRGAFLSGLLPSGWCGSLRGVFDVCGEWGGVAVHVSCDCVDVPLRPVLHADCFRR